MSLTSGQSTSDMFKCSVCKKYVRTSQGLKSHMTRLHRQPELSQTCPKYPNEPNGSTSVDTEETEQENLTRMSFRGDDFGEHFMLELSNLRSSTKIIRRLPKASRSASAACLATTIDLCVTENSLRSWKRLAKFTSSCFSVPASNTENKKIKVSLATVVNRNVKKFEENFQNFESTDYSPQYDTTTVSDSRKRDNFELPVKLIESKIADGDVTGAVRLLCSESSLAPFDVTTFELLKQKHPQEELNFESWHSSTENGNSIQNPPFPISTESIRSAIASFPSGSAAGPDMLKPQHLKDLVGHSAGASGARLLVSLVNLCSLILSGNVPEEVCPFLYGASLCALTKKNGDIRPIAVGNTFRRLAAKLGCSFAMSKLEEYLKPVQFGFGIKGGAEAVAHAARRYVSFEHSTPKVFMKLDFKNAFNSVHRRAMLKEAHTHIPELDSFLWQCYGQTSYLSFGGYVVPSSSGIQQGDPLGPALFCLAVQPLAISLTSELNLWYLDDSSLGGSSDSVLQNLKSIIDKSAEIGLELNLSKCELFFLNVPDRLRDNLRGTFREIAPEICFPNDDDFILLGAPLKDAALNKAMQSKTTDLRRLTERLEHLSAHYAFYILKNCLAIPKLAYILRCSPTWRVPDSVDTFDSTLLATLEKVTNICFTTQARAQSTLPVREGGLGLRKASSMSLPAFLSSVHSTSNLVASMLPTDINDVRDVVLEEASERWCTLTGERPPGPDHRCEQRHWEKGVIELVKTDLQLNATTLHDKARLLGVASRASGAFLSAVPSPSLGTFLPDQVFRIAVSLRLGTQICQPHQCHCGSQVDVKGLHGLSCKRNQGRASRHATANDIIRRGLVSAGYPVSLEPTFISPNDNNRRPDGITLSPWTRGRSLAWDFTCVDSQATSYLNGSAGIPAYAATNAEAKKREKYAFLGQNFEFAPIAVECLGSFGLESLKILDSIGKKIQEATGEKRATEYFLQRLSIAVQKGNAAAILGTFPSDSSLDEDICIL